MNASDFEQQRVKLAGSYLLFRLGTETYGVRVAKVRELVELKETTRVPGTPDFVVGVINLRSKVVPIIDLRCKFGMGRTTTVDKEVAIVLDHTTADGDVLVGALVEDLLEVVDVAAQAIEQRPDYGSAVFGNDYVAGMTKVQGDFVFLVEIDRVLRADESRQMAALSAAEGAVA